jgi:ferrochelatase
MPRFLPESPATAADALTGKTAVLLVNLGTPDAPTASAVRRYLAEFLADPRVVEIPKLLWLPILHGIILRVRPAKSAAKYASVWQEEGSPLRVITEQQTELVQAEFQARKMEVTVRYAMRYGNPSITSVLNELKQVGHSKILIVPMYPQYAASTTATAIDEISKWLLATRKQPEIRTIRSFCDNTAYLDALVQTTRKHWGTQGPLAADGRLLMSFHGLPKRSIKQGDPYYFECQRTGQLLAERLGLKENQFIITYQSRFGAEEWLQPYTAPTVQTLAKEGVKRLDVVCPGFVADCLETLEEIAQEVRNDFLTAGGQAFHYIPCLNSEPSWIQGLTDLCVENL